MVDEGEKESVKSLVPLTGLFIAAHTYTHPQNRRDCRRFRSLLFCFFLPWSDVICCVSESVLSAEYICVRQNLRAPIPHAHINVKKSVTAPEEYRLYRETLQKKERSKDSRGRSGTVEGYGNIKMCLKRPSSYSYKVA